MSAKATKSQAHNHIVAYKSSAPSQEARPSVRSQSWRNEEIIVFSEANDNLSLVKKCDVDCRRPREIVGVPRWNNSKDIYVTSKDRTGQDSRRYVATVKLNRLGRSLKVKRLIGAVKELYVFDSPVPRVSLMR